MGPDWGPLSPGWPPRESVCERSVGSRAIVSLAAIVWYEFSQYCLKTYFGVETRLLISERRNLNDSMGRSTYHEMVFTLSTICYGLERWVRVEIDVGLSTQCMPVFASRGRDGL